MSVFISFLMTLRDGRRSRAALLVELLALRHQLHVLERSRRQRLRLSGVDRLLWAWLVWSGWREALVIVQPATVMAWPNADSVSFGAWKSRRRTGRPTVAPDTPTLIQTMSKANLLWGAPRLHGELLKLGFTVYCCEVRGPEFGSGRR
jgi:hypothetical protein